MYQSEAAFSKAFCRHLRDTGYYVTRIESGGTKRGIPDIHWAGRGREGWIELKNIRAPYRGGDIKIPWRAGQQGWAHEYLKYSGSPSLTVAACSNTILVIPMVRWFKENWVTRQDVAGALAHVREFKL
jgi:hypothetical protein